MTMKYVAAAAVLCTSLAGCTTAQEQAATAGVTAACTAAAVGSTIYVQVESSNGASAQNISKQVSSDVGADCPVIVASTSAAISSITGSGGTATVAVSTATPVAMKRKLVAKFKVYKDAMGQPKMVFVVKPDSLSIPFLGDL